jgi:hypothetical protein
MTRIEAVADSKVTPGGNANRKHFVLSVIETGGFNISSKFRPNSAKECIDMLLFYFL